jgi:hypothetical protein
LKKYQGVDDHLNPSSNARTKDFKHIFSATLESPLYRLPIDDCPDILQICSFAIQILEVVRMLPPMHLAHLALKTIKVEMYDRRNTYISTPSNGVSPTATGS